MIRVFGDMITPMKKIYGDRAKAEISSSQVAEMLAVDPEISGLTALVINYRSLAGVSGKPIRDAFRTKHPRIAIICFYDTQEEKIEIDRLSISDDTFFSHLLKSISDVAKIEEHVNEDIERAAAKGDIDLPESGSAYESNVGDAKDIFDEGKPIKRDSDKVTKFEEVVPTVKHFEFTPGGVLTEDQAEVRTVDSWDFDKGGVTTTGAEREVDYSSFSSPEIPLATRVSKAAQDLDVESIANMLKQNSMAREMMKRETEYVGAQQAIDLLNAQVSEIFANPKMSQSEKLDVLKSLAHDRSKFVAVKNQVMVGHYLDIIGNIADSAVTAVDEAVEHYKSKYGNQEHTNTYYKDTESLEEVSADRLQSELELSAILSKLRNIYLTVNESGDAVVEAVTETSGSSNLLINDMMRPYSEQFQPANTADLVATILAQLKKKEIPFAEAEGSLQELIEGVFKLSAISADVGSRQDRILRLMQAQRVEDLVVCEDIVKAKLRTIIGPNNVGRTATAVCIATAKSRTDNTLLIDLSKDSKLRRYIEPNQTLDEFCKIRTKDKLTVVQRTSKCTYHEFSLAKALESAAPHYRYIFVLLGLEDKEEFKYFSRESVLVNFVTNGTADKIEEVKVITEPFAEDNTAKALTLVNCTVEPTLVMETIGLDPFSTKLYTVPFFSAIQDAAIRKANPALSKDVQDYFVEVFS